MTTTPRDLAVAFMTQSFEAASDTLDAYIRGGDGLTSRSSAEFAILHLVTRALTDVRWAQRAASAGYPVQAYSLLRPAHEAVQLCELFASKPGTADQWAAGEYRLFTPRRVREELDRGQDHFYSYMSERSHPRFAGLQMTIFQRTDEGDDGRRQALLHLNDVPIEVSEAYEAVATPGIVLAELAPEVGRLNFNDASHRARSYASTVRAVAAALRTGWTAMDAALDDDARQHPATLQTKEWADEYGAVLEWLADQADATYGGEG